MSDIIKQTIDKETALARGRELVQKIRAILKKREPLHKDVLKWDESKVQRNPAGSSGGTGGQFASHRAGGLSGAGLSVPPGMERGGGAASYASIMNAPTGEGFENPPKAVNFEPPKPKTGSVADVLKEATVKSTEPLGGGANASVIVVLEHSSAENNWQGVSGVYKPEAGEAWEGSFTNHEITEYITNRNFSLAEREAFAHEAGNELFGGPENNPVPETILREDMEGVDVDVSGGDNDVIWDDYELKEMYNEYKQKRLEGSAMDEVSEEMGRLFDEAQTDHVKDIEKRAEEIAEIWNEEIKDFPDDERYGSGSKLREHPVLPLGSKGPFERQAAKPTTLDPLDLIKEADINVEGELNREERDTVRRLIRQRLEEGYQELGDVDEEAAKEHLDRDQWIEDHADTENRLMESKIQSFDSWVSGNGYNQGGGGGGARNDQAPHPNGGSVQKFVELNTYGTVDAEIGAKMAVLDYVIGTMDRHSSNMGWHREGGPGTPVQPVAIDNGYSMPGGMSSEDGFRFRSIPVLQWMNRADHHAVPESIRGPILERMNKTDWKALVDRHPRMNGEEREAFLARVEKMKEALSYDEGLSTLWHDMDLMSS